MRTAPSTPVESEWRVPPRVVRDYLPKNRLTYRWKKKPYAHQVDAVKFLVRNGWGGALLMQARTGKTKVFIDYACIMHKKGEVNRVIVVCPNTVVSVWEKEIPENVPDDISYSITVWDRRGRARAPLPKAGRDRIDFVIVNYDAFSTPGKITGRRSDGTVRRSRTKGGRAELKNKLLLWNAQLIGLDESHRIKSTGASKTTALYSLAWTQPQHSPTHDWQPKIPYRVIMTGTPRTKKKRAYDLYAQWKFLNPKRFNMTLDEFKHRYCRFIPKDGYEMWVGNINEEALYKKVHRDSFAVTRAECYDLPDRLPDRVLGVELEDSAGVYDAMAQEMVAKIHTGEITEASIVLVQALRLQQITSGLAKTTPMSPAEEAKLVRIGREKLIALQDYLEDYYDSDEKIIIAAQFKADISSIVELNKKLKVPTFELHGGIDKRDRASQMSRFKRTAGSAALVVQPQAAAEGIDLREAPTILWYSLTRSWVMWDQLNDRNALSDKATQSVYLLGKGTVDEVMYQSLLEDNDIGKRIIQSPEILLRSYK